jgi:HJR/Mrr/RecB family endonuclease
MPSINDQIRDTEHQLQAATEDFQIADEKRLEIKAELRDAGQEILQLRFERMMMYAAVWHQKNFAKDPYWNIALAASICGVLVLLLFFPMWYLSGSLVFAAITYLFITAFPLLFLWSVNQPKYAHPAERIPELDGRIGFVATIHQKRQTDYKEAVTVAGRLREAAEQLNAQLESLVTSNQLQFERTIADLLASNWRQLRGVPWEEFLQKILDCHGYAVEMTRTTGDQGIDLIAQKNGISIAIQAKGYAGSVGNDAVQQAFTGMTIYGCSHCAVITNSEFSQSAIDAANKTGCILVSGPEIIAFAQGQLEVFSRLSEPPGPRDPTAY